jgi:hypothetical protein
MTKISISSKRPLSSYHLDLVIVSILDRFGLLAYFWKLPTKVPLGSMVEEVFYVLTTIQQ